MIQMLLWKPSENVRQGAGDGPACGVLLRQNWNLYAIPIMQTLESYACEELRPSAIYQILLIAHIK